MGKIGDKVVTPFGRAGVIVKEANESTVVAVKAADIPSSIPRCIAPDSPVTDAALALYFSLDAVHRNLPDRTQAYAKQVGATLNSAHMVLWGNGRDA